jgi:hypothetical protein
VTGELWNTLRQLDPSDQQRAYLETFVRLHLTVTSMQPYTHVRADVQGGGVRWHLLKADDNAVYEEKQVEFGSEANAVARGVLAPFIKDQPYEIARLVVKFSPPTLQMDVLNETNTPIASGKLIALDIEEQVRRELLAHMKEE